MRFPVFARGANPRIDRPILRKSKDYVESQVAMARAQWVDESNHSKGIVCRELLYFGPPSDLHFQPRAETGKLPMLEIPGVIFREPQSAEWQRDHKLGPTMIFLDSLI